MVRNPFKKKVMEEQKNIYLLLINWYGGVVSISERITTGNLSHQKEALKGYLLRINEYLLKHYADDEIALKHTNTFSHLYDKCNRLTTGNLSHDNDIIKCIAKNNITLINKKYLNKK